MMKAFAITLIVAVALVGATGAGASSSTATRSQCSDNGYLNAALKSSKKHLAGIRLAKNDRWAAALVPARSALAIIRNSPQPCDEDSFNYWLHRQYMIKYTVAFVRWIEESKAGDSYSADTYFDTYEFWFDSARDITLGW